MRDEFLSTKEAALLLGITQATVSRLIHKGKLQGEKMGGFFVVTRTSVQTYALVTDGKGKHDPTRRLAGGTDDDEEWKVGPYLR